MAVKKAKKQVSEICVNCKHSHIEPSRRDRLFCRCFPPVSEVFPEVKADWYCGFFEPNQESK